MSKFRTNWVERNDDSHETYNTNSQSKLKASLIKWILRNYSDAYILAKETVTIAGLKDDTVARKEGERGKELVYKNCETFITNCIDKINNTQINNVEDLYVVIPMHNLIEYRNNYLKKNEMLIISETCQVRISILL